MKGRPWDTLNPLAKVGVVIAATIQIGLLVMALWDLSRRPADSIRGPKFLWVPVCFINFVGPITYFAVGRKR
jgi:hypothetical protein